MEDKIRIIIGDDNRFFVDALKSYLLSSNEKFKIIDTAITIEELIGKTEYYNFDILILDLNFHGEASIDYLDKIRPNKDAFKIVYLTTHNLATTKAQLEKHDVEHVHSKYESIDLFPKILLEIFNSGYYQDNSMCKEDFTERQIEIIRACYMHSSEKKIANSLNISINTLKTHKQKLFAKTGTKNNLELIKFGIDKSIILI